MTNHPNRSKKPFSPQVLSGAAIARMSEYVEFILGECLEQDEDFVLGRAWRQAGIWTERSLIAAAIIYRAEALSDAPYRIIERGELADDRLCFVADELNLT
jgi:hypothetical protein